MFVGFPCACRATSSDCPSTPLKGSTGSFSKTGLSTKIRAEILALLLHVVIADEEIRLDHSKISLQRTSNVIAS